MDLEWSSADEDYDRVIANQEWSRLEATHTTAGFREGVAEQRSQALQDGFDDGFAAGAALADRLGVLVGRVAAHTVVARQLGDAVKAEAWNALSERLWALEQSQHSRLAKEARSSLLADPEATAAADPASAADLARALREPFAADLDAIEASFWVLATQPSGR